MYYLDGRPVTNNESAMWLQKVRSYNKDYMLFLKHWQVEKMPTEHPKGIVFVCDSQGFKNYGEMLPDFQSWGRNFSSSKVMFQFGYEADRGIWSVMDYPFKNIGNDIINSVPNCAGLYWVDFTIRDFYH